MDIKQFMRRWVMRYVNQDYFKIPMGDSGFVPKELSKHYRYIDQFNGASEEIERGYYIGEIGYKDYQKYKEDTGNTRNEWSEDVVMKIYVNGNHHSLSPFDASWFGCPDLLPPVVGRTHPSSRFYQPKPYSDSYLIARHWKIENAHEKLLRVSIPSSSNLNFFNGFGSYQEIAIIGYLYYKDKLLGPTILYSGSKGTEAIGTWYLFWRGREYPTEGDEYYHEIYYARSREYLELFSSIKLESYHLKYKRIWYAEDYDIESDPESEPYPNNQPYFIKDVDRWSQDEDYNIFTRYGNLLEGNLLSYMYDNYFANYLSRQISNTNTKFKKLEGEVGGLLK